MLTALDEWWVLVAWFLPCSELGGRVSGWVGVWLLNVAELCQTLRHVWTSESLPWPCSWTWSLALYLLTFCLHPGPTLPQQTLGPLLGFPDLANKNIGYLVKLEFQINKLQYTYTKKTYLFIWNANLKSCILDGNNTSFTCPKFSLIFVFSSLCLKTPEYIFEGLWFTYWYFG